MNQVDEVFIKLLEKAIEDIKNGNKTVINSIVETKSIHLLGYTKAGYTTKYIIEVLE